MDLTSDLKIPVLTALEWIIFLEGKQPHETYNFENIPNEYFRVRFSINQKFKSLFKYNDRERYKKHTNLEWIGKLIDEEINELIKYEYTRRDCSKDSKTYGQFKPGKAKAHRSDVYYINKLIAQFYEQFVWESLSL